MRAMLDCTPVPCFYSAMSKRAEGVIQQLFANRWGVALSKIPESSEKSPDFAVTIADDQVATVEVKALEDTCKALSHEEAQSLVEEASSLDDDEALLIPGASSRSNEVSRIATKIHTAAKQLARYEGPKGLVVVNEDLGPDHDDLRDALNGGLLYTADSASPRELRRYEFISTLEQKDAHARLAADRAKIDFYVWIDNVTGTPVLKRFWWATAAGEKFWKDHLEAREAAAA